MGPWVEGRGLIISSSFSAPFSAPDNFRTMQFQADDRLSMFDNWNFEEPRQFWTLFPHTPDNSFLGFVVEPPEMVPLNETKKAQGVIYGKEVWYSFGRESYLNTIGEVVELHSTFKVRGQGG